MDLKVIWEMPTKVILFDLGGVLIDFIGLREVGKLLRPDPGPSEIRNRWIASDAIIRFERGDCSPEEFARSFVEEWGLALDPGTFLKTFRGWIKSPFPGVESLLSDLRQRFVLACLSNTNELHWHAMLDESGLRNSLDKHYASHLIGKVKPDREVFSFVVQDLGCYPSEIIFFDDGVENIEGAREAGIPAYQARGLHELEARAIQLGLLGPGYIGTSSTIKMASNRIGLTKK
ncbi:MAG: HAD family hydrolase [Alphaproteobacteria bacterium]